jgi:hypothetical protein
MDGIFDIGLMATIAFVLGATILNKTIGQKRRDVCLKAFEGFNVTIELDNGKDVWGNMDLEHTGLELRYENSVKDNKHLESSYILYQSEFGNIRTVQRLVDNLSDENKLKRDKDLQRSFHPNLLRRFSRAVQRFIAVTSSSLSELLNLFIGRIRKPAGRLITDSSQSHLQSLGTAVLGHVGYSHDPLLEKFIGQRVVIEVLEKSADGKETVHEHVGVFKNYSPDFLEVLHIQVPKTGAFTIKEGTTFEAKDFRADLANSALRFKNISSRPILLTAVGQGEKEQLLNLLAGPSEELKIELDCKENDPKIFIQTINEMDLIVPRTRCVVRHRVEEFIPSQIDDIIFDIGVLLKRSSVIQDREERLRKILKKNPDSVLAAVNLGALLLEQGAFDESHTWLNSAHKKKHLLPDRGKRVEMLLRELERKKADHETEIKNHEGTGPSISSIFNIFETSDET